MSQNLIEEIYISIASEQKEKPDENTQRTHSKNTPTPSCKIPVLFP